MVFPSVTICNLNQIEADFLIWQNAYGNLERTNLLTKEFVDGHLDVLSKGQLISKCTFGVFKLTKKPMTFLRSSAQAPKERSNKKQQL